MRKKITQAEKIEFENFAKNHTIEEISKYFNISKKTARMRCFKWHCKYKKTEKKVKPEIIKAMKKYGENHTLHEIAHKFRLTYANTFTRCNRYNIKYLKQRPAYHVKKIAYESQNEKCQALGYSIPEYIGKFGMKQYKQQIINQ